ncbi:hypothetical protein OAU50_08930 [Planctomycetota bacterium]|nr:hypothetical protein [Planctomycetota bacterium]
MIIGIDNRSIDVMGGLSELEALEEAILDLASSASKLEFDVPLDSTKSASPYTLAAKTFTVRKSNSKITISIQGESVVVSASNDNLIVLSSYFGFSDEDTKGAHSHLDHFAAEDYVDQSSASLIVTLDI